MNEKESGKTENIFKDLGKRIDELIGDLSSAKENLKDEYSGQIEELKRNKETLQQEISGFKERNQHHFDEIESSLERAGQELKKAFTAAFSVKTKKEEAEK